MWKYAKQRIIANIRADRVLVLVIYIQMNGYRKLEIASDCGRGRVGGDLVGSLGEMTSISIFRLLCGGRREFSDGANAQGCADPKFHLRVKRKLTPYCD